MATSQLVTNSLENKINNSGTTGTSKGLMASLLAMNNSNMNNLSSVTPVITKGHTLGSNLATSIINNQNSFPSNKSKNNGALINTNLNNTKVNTGYNTNSIVNQLQRLSDKVGSYANNLPSKQEYLSNLTNKITELINKQKESTIGQYNTAYENEIDQLNYAKNQATKQAKEQQRQIKGTKAQQLLSLEQALARQGLSGAGEAISNRLALDIASEENANDVGLNLQDQLSEYEMQGIIALRNKDEGIKNALAQIDSDEANYMLNAYQEAENYNMNLLNYQLSIANTQADIQNAISDANYRQAQFEEGIREYNENLAEEIRQYNENLKENKRQYDLSLAENQRQFNESLKKSTSNSSDDSLLALLDEDSENVDLLSLLNSEDLNTSTNTLSNNQSSTTNNDNKKKSVLKNVLLTALTGPIGSTYNLVNSLKNRS